MAQHRIHLKEGPVFELRTAPVYLALCALALALWTAFAPGPALPTLGWAIAGMVALYAVSVVIDRAARPAPTAAHALEEAAQVNAARAAAPRTASTEEILDPRR